MSPLHRKIVEVIRSVLAARQIVIAAPDEAIYDMRLHEIELDSIDKLDLIMALEEAFDIVFDTSAVLKSDSIKRIGEHVERAQRSVRAQP